MAPIAFRGNFGLVLGADVETIQLSKQPPIVSSIDVQEWPKSFESTFAWDQNTFKSESDYTYILDYEEKTEIESALDYFKELELDGRDVDTETFPLPVLGTRLRELALDIHEGKGFHNIRGLNPNKYSSEDNMLIFLGISSYIAERRGRQDDEGDMITHICNRHEALVEEERRPIRFAKRACKFHTDTSADVLAIQTRNVSHKGGAHYLSSSYTVYNKLAGNKPRVIQTLANNDWPFDHRWPKLFGGIHERALLFYDDEHLLLDYDRSPLKGVKWICRSTNHPALRPEQLEALNEVEAVAQACKITVDLCPGDLTFVNNHCILHGREAFEDNQINERYLVRLWLRNEALAWKLPSSLARCNKMLFDHPDIEERWNIVKEPLLTQKLLDGGEGMNS